MIEKVKTKLMSLNFKTILSIIVGCTVLILAITLYQTYSKFRIFANGTVVANTSGLICEVSLDTSSENVDNEGAYFLINLQNYNNSFTNDTEMGYTITVSDSSYKGLFKYVDADNVTNGEYVSELTIPEHTFSTTSETQTIKVYVRSVSGLAETIDFVVNVDAYQITS